MNESLGRVLVVKARPFDKKIRYLVFRVYNTVEDIAKIQLTFLQQLSHIYTCITTKNAIYCAIFT